MAKSKRKRPAAPPVRVAPPARSPLALVAVGVSATLAYFMVFGWIRVAPLVLAPLFAGVLVALTVRDRTEALWLGLASGLLGSVLSLASYTVEAYLRVATSMPSYANPDVPQRLVYGLGQTAQGTVQVAADGILPGHFLANPLNATFAGGLQVLTVLIGTALTAAVAFGLVYLLDSLAARRDDAKLWVSYAAVAVLALGFVGGVAGTSANFISEANHEPQNGQYAFDGVIYMKTYYLMRSGESFYKAIVDAAAGDTRIQAAKYVKNGKFDGWIGSPSQLREPTAFYLWKYAAPNGAGGIVYLAAVLTALVLVMSYWGTKPLLGYRALFVPPFLMPVLFMMTLGYNIFFSDYWASLAFMASVFLLLRKQYVAAGVLALAAALFREVTVVWLGIMLVYAAVAWVRDRASRERLVRAGALAAMTVLFVGLYAIHYRDAGTILIGPGQSLYATFAPRITGTTFAEKVLPGTSYMMFPYGFFGVYGVGALVWLLGLFGLFTGLRTEGAARTQILAYALFWTAFYVVLGPTSSYWGQQIMPLGVAGTAMLLAGLEDVPKAFARRAAAA